MQSVDASYEGGVLKLAKPVSLRTGERVTVVVYRRIQQIEQLPRCDQDARLRTIEAFISKAA